MQDITKNPQKKREKLYIYIYYIKMAVSMIVIMPHMVSWILKMKIQIRKQMLIYMKKIIVQISLMNRLVQLKKIFLKTNK